MSDTILPATDELPDPARLSRLGKLAKAASATGGPEFGTPEWFALFLEPVTPQARAQREAALIRAAFCWVAAELGLGAPASRERLDALVREESARAVVQDVAGPMSALHGDRRAWARASAAYVARERA